MLLLKLCAQGEGGVRVEKHDRALRVQRRVQPAAQRVGVAVRVRVPARRRPGRAREGGGGLYIWHTWRCKAPVSSSMQMTVEKDDNNCFHEARSLCESWALRADTTEMGARANAADDFTHSRARNKPTEPMTTKHVR